VSSAFPLESEIQDIGKTLLTYARKEDSDLVKIHQWEYALMDWCMANPELKIRIFRFLDVFPQLTSSRAVLQHMREYFPHKEDRIPAIIRQGLLLARPALLTRGVVHHLTRTMFVKIAKLFVAASDEHGALQVLEVLDHQGMSASLDLLGERTMSEADAQQYFLRYQGLINALGSWQGRGTKPNISIKLSALEPQFDPADGAGTSERVRRRLRDLIRLARQRHIFVHIDMEEYRLRDLTLRIIRDLLHEEEFLDGVAIGVVLQAYLRDAEQCCDQLLSWARDLKMPLTIRLVRGAYWDQEIFEARERGWPVPVFTQKGDTDVMFERLTAKIVDHIPQVRLAVASHNVRSLAQAIALTRSRGVSSEDFEIQLLYGMGASLMKAVRQIGFCPRIYVPVGDPIWGMAYLVRRLLENVSQQSFVRRGIHEHTDEVFLLKPPHGKSPEVSREDDKQDMGCETFYKEYRESAVLADFRPAQMRRIQARIKQRIATPMVHLPLMIGKEERHKGNRQETVCPQDRLIRLASVSMADSGDVQGAIREAYDGLQVWRERPYSERAVCLRKAARWLTHNRDELTALEVLEVGKPIREADADIKEAIDFLNYYAFTAEKMEAQRGLPSLPQEHNILSWRPRGVAAIIAPWNFPIAILTGMSAAALVTGNTVILKPAEQAMLCGWQVFEAYRQAGIPLGVINFLPGEGEVIGPPLVSDPRVALIAFTGSREVGCRIVQQANASVEQAGHIKKVIVEMGGKNAAIIDETADLDQTIPAVLQSAFGYAGQKCSALSRLYVLNTIFEMFVARLTAAAAAFPVGDPAEPLIRCGPLIDGSAYKKVSDWMLLARKTGKVLFESVPLQQGRGWYVPLMIVADLPEDSKILTQEIFGPLLAVIRVSSFQEALGKVNDSAFALTGAIFSRTPSHIDQAKREFEVGNLYINRQLTGAIVGRHPFGGYKMSGSGTKAGGSAYLQEFVIARTLSENVSRHGFTPDQEISGV
jgi:RHH-type proline utilization regulon transcriptional repressor/proline dehydrogenase/delta 1-pyrroline-5-carboxylate dehydrogenase